MIWQTLLTATNEQIVLPWLGGRTLCSAHRTFSIDGPLPHDHGWYTFTLTARRARFTTGTPVDRQSELLAHLQTGYLVGDRLAIDAVIHQVAVEPATAGRLLPHVHLLEPGLDRFARVTVGQIHTNGPLIYHSDALPLGPEDDVLAAFLDRKSSIADIKGVTPGLDAAFRLEQFHRTIADARRAELARLATEEAAQRALVERQQQLLKLLGAGVSRRELAHVDFETAARAALAVGGAELLDWKRPHPQRAEWVVKYRLVGRRFECVCDQNLRIIDAGICLNEYRTGTKGDDRFTLESLPGVVQTAARMNVLVVFRHV